MNSQKILSLVLLCSFNLPTANAANGGHVMPRPKDKKPPEKMVGPLTAPPDMTCSTEDIKKYHLLNEYKSGNNSPSALAGLMALGVYDLQKLKRRIALIKETREGYTDTDRPVHTPIKTKLNILEKIVEVSIETNQRVSKVMDVYFKTFAKEIAPMRNEPAYKEAEEFIKANRKAYTDPEKFKDVLEEIEKRRQILNEYNYNNDRIKEAIKKALLAAKKVDPSLTIELNQMKRADQLKGHREAFKVALDIQDFYSAQHIEKLNNTQVDGLNVYKSEPRLSHKLSPGYAFGYDDIVYKNGKFKLIPTQDTAVNHDLAHDLLRAKINTLALEGQIEYATSGYRIMNERLYNLHNILEYRPIYSATHDKKGTESTNASVTAKDHKALQSNPEASEFRNGKFTGKAVKAALGVGLLGAVSMPALAMADTKKYEEFLISCGVPAVEANQLAVHIRKDTVAVDAFHKNINQCEKVDFDPNFTPLDLGIFKDDGDIEIKGSACLILKNRSKEMELAFTKEAVIQNEDSKKTCDLGIGNTQTKLGRFITIDGINYFETAYSGKEIGVRLPIEKSNGMARFNLENVRCVRDIGEGKTQEVPDCQSFMNKLWATTDGISYHQPTPELSRDKFYNKGKETVLSSNAQTYTRGLELIQNNMGEMLNAMSDLNLIGCFDKEAPEILKEKPSTKTSGK